jgi:23S rRNA pseudouridine2605 synthase
LLLLTDDGDLTLKLSHPRYEHAKSYLVLVDRKPGTDTLAHFRRGIQLDDGVTAPSHWRVLEHPAMVPPSDDPSTDEGVWLHVTMHEGRKRQIRRMAAAEKLQVRRLVRVGLGSLRLDRKLRPGESRSLTRREMQQLLDEADAVEPAAIPRRREQGAGAAARGPAGRAPRQAVAAAYTSQRRPSGAAAQPSGPHPRGPRREDQPEREPGRRPPYAGGPKPGPRPAGPRSSGPRREDPPEREPGRRPPYAGGPKPGPRPAGPRSSGPRREDQPEREPGRRPPYAGGPKPGPRPAGPRSSGPRRE